MTHSSPVEWFHHQLDTSDSADVKRAYLQRDAADADTPADPNDLLRVGDIATWSLHDLLWRGRLISLDERTLWECVSPTMVSHRVHHTIDPWNEQLAVKVAYYFLQSRAAPSSPELPPSQARPIEAVWGRLRDELDAYAASAIKPLGAATVHDNLPLTAAPTSVSSSPAAAAASDGVVGAWSDKVRFLSMDAGNDLSEGSLRCVAPVESLGVLLEVPRAEMFFLETLLQYCALGRAIAAAPALQDLRTNEEAMLVLCLTYERFVVGAADSHWRRLLDQCPASYPTIPTTWTLSDLSELDGLDMLDDVLTKRKQLQTFADQLDAALVSIFHEMLVAQGEETAAPPENVLRAAFCWDHLAWAQSTFDSRAFNLNVDGTVVMALVPLADMINHTNRTDVLIRKVEPNGGPFRMQVGARLTDADVGRELWMSYGPLQNWELLQHYGFVLGCDNVHDKLPFPLALPDLSETATEDAACDAHDWDARRRNLLRRYSLCLPGRCWIPHDGVPAPALLAVLRIQLAQAEEFAVMESHRHGPFATLSPATEAAVVSTVAATVRCVLEVFPTTLSEDEEILKELKEPADEDEQEDGDMEAMYNYTLCVQLRVGLKRIASRALDWCQQHA